MGTFKYSVFSNRPTTIDTSFSNPVEYKQKQRQFYRAYKAGILDQDRITDDGWKTIFEYELEEGYTKPDEIPISVVEKYNIDTSLGMKEEPINSIQTDPIEPVIEEKDKSLKDKLLSFFSNIGTLQQPKELDPISQRYKDSYEAKKIEEMESSIAPNLEFQKREKDMFNDPLLMALNTIADPNYIGQHTKNFIDQYNKDVFKEQRKEIAIQDTLGVENPLGLPVSDKFIPNTSISQYDPKTRTTTQKVKDTAKGVDEKVKSFGYGLGSEFFGNTIERATDKVFEKSTKDLSNYQKEQIKSDREYWTEEKLFNSFLGKAPDEEITKGEKRALTAGAFGGNIGKLLLFSEVLGGTGKPLLDRGIVGAVSGAESAYGRGEEAEDIVKEAVISSGAFVAGSKASQVVGDKLIKQLIPVFKLHPEWGNHLTALVRGTKGATMGTTGTLTRVGLSKALNKETEIQLKDVLQAGLIMGVFETVVSYVPWDMFTQNKNEIKDFNIRLHTVSDEDLKSNGYIKLADLERTGHEAYVSTANPFAGDIYINQNNKDIVVMATKQGGFLVPVSMAKDTPDTQTIREITGIANTNLRKPVDYTTQPDFIDKTKEPDKYYRVLDRFMGKEGYKPYTVDGNQVYGRYNKTEDISGPEILNFDEAEQKFIRESNVKDLTILKEINPKMFDAEMIKHMESMGYKYNSFNNTFTGYPTSYEGSWEYITPEEADEKFTNEYFTHYEKGSPIDLEGISARTQDVDIGRFAGDYEIDRSKLDSFSRQFTKELTDKGYKEFKPGLWVLEKDGKLVDVIPEFATGKDGKPVPLFDIEVEGKIKQIPKDKVKGFTGDEYDITPKEITNKYIENKNIIDKLDDHVKKHDPKEYNEFMENIESTNEILNTIDMLSLNDETPIDEFEAIENARDIINNFFEKEDIKAIFDTFDFEIASKDMNVPLIIENMKKFNKKFKSFMEGEEIDEEPKDKPTTIAPITKDKDTINVTDIDDTKTPTKADTKPTDIELTKRDIDRIKRAGDAAYNRIIKEKPHEIPGGYLTKEDIKEKARRERINAEEVMRERILREKREELIAHGPDYEKIEREKAIEDENIKRDSFIDEAINNRKLKFQIVNDYVNRDYSNILNDFNKGRITKEEIEQVSNLAKDYLSEDHTQFMEEQLSDVIKLSTKSKVSHPSKISTLKDKAITGYREGEEHGEVGAGTFYWIGNGSNLSAMQNFNEIKDNERFIKKDLKFNNLLEIPESELDKLRRFTNEVGFEDTPSRYLVDLWDLKDGIDKKLKDYKEGKELEELKGIELNDEEDYLEVERILIDKAVSKKAKELGYDGIKYGDSQLQDLKELEAPQKEYNIVRIDEKDATIKPSEKPHGLYVSIDREGFESPHDMAGDTEYKGIVRPKNPLIVKDKKIKHARFEKLGLDEGHGSAGILALKELLPKSEFNDLLSKSKSEMIEILNEKYPGADYNKYFDSYELLEAYGGQLAREKGYDSIILEDKEFPNLSEVAVLDDSIINIKSTKKPTAAINIDNDEIGSRIEGKYGHAVKKGDLDWEVITDIKGSLYSTIRVATKEEAEYRLENNKGMPLSDVEVKLLEKGAKNLTDEEVEVLASKMSLIDSSRGEKINSYRPEILNEKRLRRSNRIKISSKEDLEKYIIDSLMEDDSVAENLKALNTANKKKSYLMNKIDTAMLLLSSKKYKDKEFDKIYNENKNKDFIKKIAEDTLNMLEAVEEPVTEATTTTHTTGQEGIKTADTEDGTYVTKGLKGNTTTAKTNDGKDIELEYQIVSANDLIASHNIGLHKNPDYPEELQPRDRGRKASIMQVDNIINNLNPEWLGESPKLSDGSPIVGPDYIVESGNGRVIALQKMYDIKHDNKERYIKWLDNNKNHFGIKGELPNNPILVRVRKTDVDRVEFTRQANISEVASLSVLEQAKIDSEKLDSYILSRFSPNDEGKINTKENKKFINTFVQNIIPQSEHSKYIDSKGNITVDGILRIRNAIFYKVYQDENILSLIAESTDNNIKVITNTLLNIAPKLLSIRDLIDKGMLYDLDFSKDIINAVNKYISLKNEDMTVDEFINQISMFGNELTNESKIILITLEEHNRSTKKLTKYFNYVFEGIGMTPDPRQETMLGTDKASKIDVLDYAERRFVADEKGIVAGQTEILGEVEQTSSGETIKGTEDEGTKEETEIEDTEYSSIKTLLISKKGDAIKYGRDVEYKDDDTNYDKMIKNITIGHYHSDYDLEKAKKNIDNNIMGNHLIMYHGTITKHYNNISENGLIGDKDKYGPALTTHRGNALSFAIQTKTNEGGNEKTGIIVFAIPESEWNKIYPNVSTESFQYNDKVLPKEYILGYVESGRTMFDDLDKIEKSLNVKSKNKDDYTVDNLKEDVSNELLGKDIFKNTIDVDEQNARIFSEREVANIITDMVMGRLNKKEDLPFDFTKYIKDKDFIDDVFNLSKEKHNSKKETKIIDGIDMSKPYIVNATLGIQIGKIMDYDNSDNKFLFFLFDGSLRWNFSKQDILLEANEEVLNKAIDIYKNNDKNVKAPELQMFLLNELVDGYEKNKNVISKEKIEEYVGTLGQYNREIEKPLDKEFEFNITIKANKWKVPYAAKLKYDPNVKGKDKVSRIWIEKETKFEGNSVTVKSKFIGNPGDVFEIREGSSRKNDYRYWFILDNSGILRKLAAIDSTKEKDNVIKYLKGDKTFKDMMLDCSKKVSYEGKLTEKPDNKPDDKPENKNILNKNSQQIADKIKEKLFNKEKTTFVELFNIADEAYGGSQAEGIYTVKDAYDGLELGVNQYLLEQTDIDLNSKDIEVVKENIRSLESLLELLPTQTKRSKETVDYQQFSTPPNIAYIANWLANIDESDTMLEPSAGIGGIAVFSKINGAEVIANELSERRLSILKNMPFDGFYNENAEQINNILPDKIKPSVIVMNPPFSATAGRMDKNKTKYATLHIEQSLLRLEDNGRLVAIVGNTMGEEFSQFKDWWDDIKKEYNVLANITVDGKNYRKYGTSYDVNILVIDKSGPTKDEVLTGKFEKLTDIIDRMEVIRSARPQYVKGDNAAKQDTHKSTGQEITREGEANNRPLSTTHTATDHLGARGGPMDAGGKRSPSRTNVSTTEVQDTEEIDGINDTRGGTNIKSTGHETDGSETDVPIPDRFPKGSNVVVYDNELEIKIKKAQTKVDKENLDKVFSDYTPQKLKIKGAKPHRGKLSESAAMGAVLPPDPIYVPNLPKKIIEKGELSDAQLEAIAYAGQAHSQILPNGYRRGFFIGDGTGVGKGREIAGIIYDNFRQGRRKAVWVSKNNGLFKDALRDIEDIGMDPELLFTIPKKLDDVIDREEGILFLGYGTLRSMLNYSVYHHNNINKENYKPPKKARIDQIIEWLQEDFDGVIAFDEAHLMANAIEYGEGLGTRQATQTALSGQLLRETLKDSRVLYVSATGASEIHNLAYLDRLGLWGKGTPFSDVHNFIDSIGSGGMASMELVARDMKSMGVYLSRSLSYDGVTYERLEHELTKEQEDLYDVLSNAWQIVLQNMSEALNVTNSNSNARRNATGQFWSSQQRFFNQVLTTMTMPSVIKNIEKNLDDEHAVVIQLTNTNEAMQERQLEKVIKKGLDLEDIDMSPKDILIEYLKNSYPVQQFEDYTDDKGNKQSRPVVDSNGNPVLNREAVKMRDRLIAMLGSINMPESPLDMLINTFGTKNVAEVTGRSRRVVRYIDKDTNTEKAKIEKRTASVVDKDIDDFINDKKRILIFSKAGDTGKSYHASNDYKNKRKRIHYVLQPGFSAMSAMQGLGRTHRTNQAHAPHVILPTTNIAGHKRFISTIARRLDQLGALTRGQREAGTQGLFGERDNLEGPTARDALHHFYRELGNNKIPNLDRDTTLKQMGLYDTLIDEEGRLKEQSDVFTDVKKFLNRLLVLDTGLQAMVFQAYSDILDTTIENAIARGELDVGLENFTADSVKIREKNVIRVDEETGAETEYISFDVKEMVETLSLDDLNTNSKRFKGFYVNTISGIVRAYFVSRSITNTDGTVEQSYRGYEPMKGKVQRATNADLNKNTMKKLTLKEAKPLWEKQLSEVPKYKESTIHLITGALLPIWNRLPEGTVRVMRVITDDNEEYLGRLINENHIESTLRRLGAEHSASTFDVANSIDKVLKDNYIIHLSNRWRIKKSMVSGENRLEVVGPTFNYFDTLLNMGLFTEVIQYDTRFFIPLNEAEQIIKEITKYNPITNVIKDDRRASRGLIPSGVNTPKGVKKKDTIKPISDIINDIEKDFNISISSKRFRGRRGEIGQYKTHSESIRVKKDNDIQTIAHELGHHLDKLYGFSNTYNNLIKDMIKKLDLSNKYKEEELPGEAIAEFIKLYLTSEKEAYALNEEFYNVFINTLSKDDLNKLNKHREDTINWYGHEVTKRIGTTIKSHTDKKKFDLDKTKLEIEMAIFDDLAPIRKLTEFVELTTGEKLNFTEHPYVLALQSRRANAIAKSQIVVAQSNPEGSIIGPSFKELLKDIDAKERKSFDEYLKTKHAITLHQFDKQVFSDDFTIDDLISAKEQYEREYPHFIKISEDLYEWWGRFVEEWVVAQGFISLDTWIELREKYPTYVPNFRVLDDIDMDSRYKNLAKKGFGNQHSPIKKMKGSAKDTYGVTESLVLYIDKIVKTQMRNEVGLAIHNLYNKTEGLGQFLTKIESEIEMNKFNAIGLKEALKQLLIIDYIDNLDEEQKKEANKILAQKGYDGAVKYLTDNGIMGPEIIDTTIDDIITYFTPRQFSTDSTVYTVIDKNGKTHFYEVHDPLLLEAMLNLNSKQMDKVTRTIGKFKRIFTNLTTGANPIFGVVSNIWGDVPEAYAFGSYKNPFDFGKELSKSMVEIFKDGEDVKKYYAIGGGLSSPISPNRKLMEETLNELFPDKKKADIASMVSYGMSLVEQFNDTIESAPRYTEFKKVLDKYGDTYEGRLRAMYEAGDVTVNFLRRGKIQGTIIGQGVPFLNAGLQGLYKLNQEFIKRKGPGRSDGGGRGKDNKKFLSLLIKALTCITVFEALQMIAYKGDEDYEKLSAYIKDNFWLIKYAPGKFVRIRKPRELGMLFGTMFKRGFMSVFEGKDDAWDKFANSFMNTFLPPNPINDHIFAPFSQVRRNTSWKETPIIPKRLENLPKEMQYDSSTSEIAKALSKVLPEHMGNLKSPKAIDYIIQQYTGIIGQILIPATTENMTVLEALSRKVTTDMAYSNDKINDFYETKQKLDAANKVYNETGDITKDFNPVLRHRYNELYKELSDMWGEINSIKKDEGLSKEDKKKKEREIRFEMIEVVKEENLKPTPYNEFKVLYNKAKEITDNYKETFEATGLRPELSDEENTILMLFNMPVKDNRSQIKHVNYQLNQINKRINQIEEAKGIPDKQKEEAILRLKTMEDEITDKYMGTIKNKYNIDINGLFK